MTLTFPRRSRPGAYRLFACADSAREVRERSERNNCRRSGRRLRCRRRPAGAPGPPARPPGRTRADGDCGSDADAGSRRHHAAEHDHHRRPDGLREATTATFQFTSTEAPAAFECRRDGAAFAACDSPTVLRV